MAKIEIYTTPICPYCVAAKQLLTQKGASFTEIDVSRDNDLRQVMMQRAHGKRTVPQIFIDDQHIGGCDDLYDLNDRGGLDPLLGAS
jgi:glutaredoxin 3